MKVALVHDWLIHMRGGEKVLEAIAELYPDATIYTLLYKREKLSPTLKEMKIKTSFLQKLPGIHLYYRWFLPFLPWIIETMKVEEADVVISSSHCVAKGIQIPESARHICYCHTPMRYIWGFEDIYFKKCPLILKPILNLILNYLRKWDVKSSRNVDEFVANAKNVEQRIRDIYHRSATVIYPPVDTDFYHPEGEVKDYYLVVSAFVPYKRVDLVIEAFNQMSKKLLVVGSGPLGKRYRALRKSPLISFLGSVSGKDLRQLFSGARALIFPTNEDFGIVPLEAQACGAPVIALRKGGALESVQDGVFFDEQSPDAICHAVEELESRTFERGKIAASIERFSRESFKEQIQSLVEGKPTEVMTDVSS